MPFGNVWRELSRSQVVHGVIVVRAAEDLLDAVVGDFFLAADALGVDAEQHLHTVAGAVGDLGGGDAAVEPQGDGRVPQVVGAACEGRGSLLGGER